MNDKELLGYCEIHCTTQRAMFSADHLNILFELAGANRRVTGWHSAHEDVVMPLVREARRRMAQPKLTLIQGGVTS